MISAFSLGCGARTTLSLRLELIDFRLDYSTSYFSSLVLCRVIRIALRDLMGPGTSLIQLRCASVEVPAPLPPCALLNQRIAPAICLF